MSELQKASMQRGSYAFVVKMLPGIQVLLDSLVLLVSGYALYYGLVYYSYKSADFYNTAIVFNWLLTVMLFYFAGLYRFEDLIHFWRTLDRVLIAVATTFVFMIALAFAVKISSVFSRVWFAAFAGCSLFGLLCMRGLVSWIIGRLGKYRLIARNVAIYGTGVQLEHLLQYLKVSSPSFVNLSGVFSGDATASLQKAKIPYSGTLEDLITLVRRGEVDDIVLALPWAEQELVADIVQKLRELPTNVFLSVDSVGFSIPMRQPPSYFQKLPFYEVIGKPLTGWDVILKTLEDYVLGSLLLLIAWPLLLVVAILVKLDSPGPVIFKQKRLGFNNQPFDIYKFRSMTYQPETAEKTVQAQQFDPRVTTIGAILRRTSIDELPQLLNVLNGTMSLVGPRPHAIDHNEEYAQKIRGYFSRHRVKPGITGLAQIKGFRGLTDTIDKMENRVKYDIEYTDTWSLLLDFKILVMTVFITFSAQNAF
jgi:putative colanic acid biosysnthesis UDP-glucose lipid carrier transferase